ncbi:MULTISPECIES: DUF1064 domain-containing protein [unclassified Clostridium]|uniref:DUF1064 domain-containing protein n=1 Tax=unclassified Clostridium TaxID=2614128 RepID=UPI0020797D75|nr:DUF1064 domain-containing protein [Clostridium sp. RO3]
MARFYSKKVIKDGIKYDSQTEYEFECYIKKNKYELGIKDIKRQQKFILMDKFRDIDNKMIRDITYTADYVLTMNDGTTEIVDCKGSKSTIEETFKIKFKLMKNRYRDFKYRIIIKDENNKSKWLDINSGKEIKYGV